MDAERAPAKRYRLSPGSATVGTEHADPDAPSAARAAAPRRSRVMVWLLVLMVGAVDLASGAWARAVVHRPGSGWLHLDLVSNRGVAFGIGGAHPRWAVALSGALAVLLAVWLARSRPAIQRVELALALGGGVGNLADRLVHGSVTDWMHVAWYPATFNLADLAIRAGLLIVVVSLVRGGRHRS